jgi:hypothetical protein
MNRFLGVGLVVLVSSGNTASAETATECLSRTGGDHSYCFHGIHHDHSRFHRPNTSSPSPSPVSPPAGLAREPRGDMEGECRYGILDADCWEELFEGEASED